VYARGIGVRLQQARYAVDLTQKKSRTAPAFRSLPTRTSTKRIRAGTPMNPRLITLIALRQLRELQVSEVLAEPLPHLAE